MPASMSTVCSGVRTSSGRRPSGIRLRSSGSAPLLPQRLRHDPNIAPPSSRKKPSMSGTTSKSPNVTMRRAPARTRRGCLSSISRPPALAGWMKAIRDPCAPCRGCSSMNLTPARLQRRPSPASMSATRKQRWCSASPRFSRNFATGASGAVGLHQFERRRRRHRQTAADAGRRLPARRSSARASRANMRTNGAGIAPRRCRRDRAASRATRRVRCRRARVITDSAAAYGSISRAAMRSSNLLELPGAEHATARGAA